ncbi:MAG: hypothetical protein HYT08_04900 [Candidatus Levybacteria bacterium]|nr:hypothetical protein [Candidatus Levybacteria bacterium]
MPREIQSAPSQEGQPNELESASAVFHGEEILLIRVNRQALPKFGGQTGNQVIGYITEYYYGKIGDRGYILRRKEALSPAILNFEDSDIPLSQPDTEVLIRNDAVNKWENQEPENAMLYKELKRTYEQGIARVQESKSS